MSSLAIQGFRGGGIAAQGFPGGIGLPEPPVLTVYGKNEFGAGTVTNIRASEGSVVLGPWQTQDREQMRLKVHARGNATFNLNYEFSTDKGTTWYVGDQRSSSTVSVDDGTNYTQQAHFHPNLGYWWRISVFNTDVTQLNAAIEWRFHSY